MSPKGKGKGKSTPLGGEMESNWQHTGDSWGSSWKQSDQWSQQNSNNADWVAEQNYFGGHGHAQQYKQNVRPFIEISNFI